NPIEQEGTYPLPEAELDRFMLKVLIDYPSEGEEQDLVKQVTTGQVQDTLSVAAIESVVSAADIPRLQHITAHIQVDDAVFDYAVRIARSSRQWHSFAHGAGPRASIALIRAARANALLEGREFVTPDDVKSMALPVMRHRVALTAEMEIEGLKTDQALQQLLQEVEAPRL
ncbi:MAG: MoxR family ATPase, partial [Ketobacter sp.]|nr:MoxR family ATPase [Ketobacter sp.]